MRRVFLSAIVLLLSLLGCSTLTLTASPATPMLATTSTDILPSSTPELTLPISVYRDASVGFKMDYP